MSDSNWGLGLGLIFYSRMRTRQARQAELNRIAREADTTHNLRTCVCPSCISFRAANQDWVCS